MLSWQWPWLFTLLPLPLIARWLLAPREVASDAIRVPFYDVLQRLQMNQAASFNSSIIRALLCWVIWACLVTAVARPTWVGEPILLPQERRDMMLAVDISGSMREEDMLVNRQYVPRINAVKAVVGEFIEQRKGDRLGLILYGTQGYLQTPLTYDSQTVKQQLLEAELGFAGNATAIGDAIGLAIKRLRDRPADSRVLILLTDGANTAGSDPLQATKIAAEAGIRIHAVGVGADAKLTRDIFGRTRKVNPARDLDEATLQDIAEQTGGQYFRARDPQQLQEIYKVIDELEPIAEEQSFRPTRSLSHRPIGVALLLAAMLALSMQFGRSSPT